MQAPDGSAAPLRQSLHQAMSMDSRPGARIILLEIGLRHVLDVACSVVRHRHLPGNAELHATRGRDGSETRSRHKPASGSAAARSSGCAAGAMPQHSN